MSDTKPEGKPFGYYLKEKRRQLGMSQAELADRVRIQRTTISRLESTAGNPQWLMVRQLVEDGMGISLSEFFRLVPREARAPIIHITGPLPAPKVADLMLKTQAVAVPIVGSAAPLRSKVVTDQDITGYCTLDHQLLKEYKGAALVVWICADNGLTCDWLLTDIKDTTLTDGGMFLVDLDGKVEARRTWLSERGILVLDACEGDIVKPIAFWGRQREQVEVLGRIVMTSRLFHRTKA